MLGCLTDFIQPWSCSLFSSIQYWLHIDELLTEKKARLFKEYHCTYHSQRFSKVFNKTGVILTSFYLIYVDEKNCVWSTDWTFQVLQDIKGDRLEDQFTCIRKFVQEVQAWKQVSVFLLMLLRRYGVEFVIYFFVVLSYLDMFL